MQNTPLTVNTALALLTRIAPRHGEDLLAVSVETGKSTLGPRPVSPVTAVHPGFDWDAGKVFVVTEKPLGVVGPELDALKKQYRQALEALGWISMALKDKRLPNAEKVEAALATLDTFRKRGESGNPAANAP